MNMTNESTSSEFLSLPPELRERICRLYFESISQAQDELPEEPPLSYVTKQIRTESLPIYYSTYILPVHTYVRTASHGEVRLKTERWYHRYIPPSKLKLVEHFRLHFALIERYTGERVPIDFHIKLLRRTNSYELRHSFATRWIRDPHRIGDPADFDELISVLRKHLTSELDELVKDPGVGRFAAEHLDRLVKIDPDSLPLQTKG